MGLCRGCGYDLAGLSVSGKCPECGRPVVDSLRGDLLAFAGPEYVETLHRGVGLILASILFVVATMIGGFVILGVISAAGPAGAMGTLGDFVQWGSIAVGLIGTGLSVVGWYLFSTPDPGRHILDRGDRPRQVLRIAVVISAALTVMTYTIELIDPATRSPGLRPVSAYGLLQVLAILLMIAGFVLWAIMFFAAMRYLQWMAPRLPNAAHVKTAGRYMWLLPVLYIPGMALCGLGPLVALVLYYNLLNAFRKELKVIRTRKSGIPV